MDDIMDESAPDFSEGLDEYGSETPAEDIVASFAARIGPEIDEIAHNVRLLMKAATNEIWERGSKAGKAPALGDLLRLEEEIESAKKLNAKLRRATQMVKNEGFGTDLRQVMRAQDQRNAELKAREEVCVETEIALDQKDEALEMEKKQHWAEFRNERSDWNKAVKEEWKTLKEEEKRLKEEEEELKREEKRLKEEEEEKLKQEGKKVKDKLKQEEQKLKEWSEQLEKREKELKREEERLAEESTLRAIFRRLKNKLKK